VAILHTITVANWKPEMPAVETPATEDGAADTEDGDSRHYFCSFSPVAAFETYFQQRVRGSFRFQITLAVFYTALVVCLPFLPQVGREIEN
jgi:hypothetical protein